MTCGDLVVVVPRVVGTGNSTIDVIKFVYSEQRFLLPRTHERLPYNKKNGAPGDNTGVFLQMNGDYSNNSINS